MLNIFGKRKVETFSELLSKYAIYKELTQQLAKVGSLQKLGRGEEANIIIANLERKVARNLEIQPHDKWACCLMALFYIEASFTDKAEVALDGLLRDGAFAFTPDERDAISAELQKLRRERPTAERSKEGPEGYTQVYCCANCGRLHNYVSMPCPNCDWSPDTVEATAKSMVLSTAYLDVPALLLLCRELAKGRAVDDVVPNLSDSVRTCMTSPEHRQATNQVFHLLREHKAKNHRDLNLLRDCRSCGKRVRFSGLTKCDRCGAPIDWPDAVRTLVCMDNLLWLFESRVELSFGEEFSDFVCLLVAMTNKLLRKQEAPSQSARKYGLGLLTAMGAVCDTNRGAVIDTHDPSNMQVYMVKDHMVEGSETYGIVLFGELQFLAEKFRDGVSI